MTEREIFEQRAIAFRRASIECSLWAALCAACAGTFLGRGEFVGWLSLVAGIFCASVASGAIHFHAVCTELLARTTDTEE